MHHILCACYLWWKLSPSWNQFPFMDLSHWNLVCLQRFRTCNKCKNLHRRVGAYLLHLVKEFFEFSFEILLVMWFVSKLAFLDAVGRNGHWIPRCMHLSQLQYPEWHFTRFKYARIDASVRIQRKITVNWRKALSISFWLSIELRPVDGLGGFKKRVGWGSNEKRQSVKGRRILFFKYTSGSISSRRFQWKIKWG